MTQIRPRFLRALPGIVLALALASSAVHAKEDGSITGRSTPTTAGCGNCHGDKSADTTVTLAGAAQVQKGSTNRYTVTIKGGGTSGGVNIRASAGQLALEANDTSLKLVGTELTHTGPKPASGGTVVFTFNLIAPSVDTAIVLTVAGNSVNDDGLNQGDEWNFAQPLTVAAGSPTEVPDADQGGCSVAGSASLGFVALVLLALTLLRRPPAYQRRRTRSDGPVRK